MSYETGLLLGGWRVPEVGPLSITPRSEADTTWIRRDMTSGWWWVRDRSITARAGARRSAVRFVVGHWTGGVTPHTTQRRSAAAFLKDRMRTSASMHFLIGVDEYPPGSGLAEVWQTADLVTSITQHGNYRFNDAGIGVEIACPGTNRRLLDRWDPELVRHDFVGPEPFDRGAGFGLATYTLAQLTSWARLCQLLVRLGHAVDTAPRWDHGVFRLDPAPRTPTADGDGDGNWHDPHFEDGFTDQGSLFRIRPRVPCFPHDPERLERWRRHSYLRDLIYRDRCIYYSRMQNMTANRRSPTVQRVWDQIADDDTGWNERVFSTFRSGALEHMNQPYSGARRQYRCSKYDAGGLLLRQLAKEGWQLVEVPPLSERERRMLLRMPGRSG